MEFDTTYKDEQFPRMINAVSTVMNYMYRADGNYHTWFVSFGALLFFFRDRYKDKIFDSQDMDISVIYGEVDPVNLIANFSQSGYILKNQVINDVTKKPFQMVFGRAPECPYLPAVEIDIYFWVKANGYYWHTYDFGKEGKEVLQKYTFKGIPAPLFEKGTIEYTWDALSQRMRFPVGYGEMLDYWYPPKRDPVKKDPLTDEYMPIPDTGWYIEDRHYGQSKTERQVTLETCKNMTEDLK